MSIQFYCSACRQSFEHCTCPRTYNPPPFSNQPTSLQPAPVGTMLFDLNAQSLEAIRQIVAEEIQKALQADREADEERSEPRIVRWMEA